MSTPCYTRGPWRIDRRAILAGPGFGFCIAEVFSGGAASLAEADANGHMLAAAPDLYEALTELFAAGAAPYSGDLSRYNAAVKAAVNALAKAEGRAA